MPPAERTDGNTVYNGTRDAWAHQREARAPSMTGVYSLSNPFPAGVVPLVGFAARLATIWAYTPNTDAALAAHDQNL